MTVLRLSGDLSSVPVSGTRNVVRGNAPRSGGWSAGGAGGDGARLVGGLVDGPIASWRFVEKAGQCQLETRPQYPHSVTVNCWHLDGQLYIGCMRCQGKVWSRYVVETKLARVKIASQLYRVTLERTTDPQEMTLSWAARWDQLGRARPVGSVPEHYWLYRVTSR